MKKRWFVYRSDGYRARLGESMDKDMLIGYLKAHCPEGMTVVLVDRDNIPEHVVVCGEFSDEFRTQVWEELMGTIEKEARQ